MFTTLVLKEIHETLISWRFVVTSIVLVIVIPLGIYMSLSDYCQRLSSYQDAVAAYEKKTEGQISSGFVAEGFRSPSPLSVLITGIDPILPNRAATVSSWNLLVDSVPTEGTVTIKNVYTLDDPYVALFGNLDFMFIISVILSMLAFVFTFAMIAGEKELGTLKQIFANPVSRWSLISAKITGTFFLYLIPFLVACLLGGIILNMSDVFPFATPGMIGSISMIVGVSIVFIFAMFALGILVSASCRNSVTAFISLLFVWVVIALIIPKLSPMIAQKIHPVVGREVIDRRIDILIADISNEMKSREDALFQEILPRHGATMGEYKGLKIDANGLVEHTIDKEKKKALIEEFDDRVESIRADYTERLFSEADRLRTDYTNDLAVQQGIARQLSRLSPVSCLTYILTDIASTGPREEELFAGYAGRLREDYERFMKDHISVFRRGTFDGGFSMKPVDVNTRKPHMENYHYATAGEAFGYFWPDLLLLVLYTILFITGGFVMFIKYDVR